MKLSLYSDYALRLMIYLATIEGRLTSIAEVATIYNVSQNHLMKIVQELGRAGFVETIRGRNGGIRLAGDPEATSLGAIVRLTEAQPGLVDCSTCRIASACTLPKVLAEALEAFFRVLDGYTLGDLVRKPKDFQDLFLMPDDAPASP